MPDARKSTRLYVPGELAPGRTILLPAQQAHHAARVLRLAPRDPVTLFNGDGGEYSGVIARAGRDGVAVEVGGYTAVSRESALEVTLAQAVSSGERMDYTIQKAVELGVAAIQPLASSRSVVRLDSERARRRLGHWRTVAAAACEQCGRNRVPDIRPILPLYDWLAGEGRAPGPLAVLLTPGAPAGLRGLPAPQAGVVLLAGPEGGLDAAEEDAAVRAGYAAERLGPRVLRTETAAVAALAAMQALWGDF